MRWGLILGLFLFNTTVYAACPVADTQARSGTLSQAIPLYHACALQNGDDETQLYLARIYETGQGDVSRNVQRALLFYHLSAENGNASAMVGLSKLLTALDSDDRTRNEIPLYFNKIRSMLNGSILSHFSGQLLHPYALLLLASEKPESKWFYLTNVKSDPMAAQLLKSYPIDPETKQAATKEATRWKQHKMLYIAREVFSVDEYNEFYDTLYPDSGIPNSFARSQAVARLKDRVESKLKK